MPVNCTKSKPVARGHTRSANLVRGSCDLSTRCSREVNSPFEQDRNVKLANVFWAYVLARNIRYQQDLVDQHCNSSEKRLARILLLLAHFDGHGATETTVPKMSHETLAEMVGTTRSRISFFMNRFKKTGFIDYGSQG